VAAVLQERHTGGDGAPGGDAQGQGQRGSRRREGSWQ
jgi:hypothetical protein